MGSDRRPAPLDALSCGAGPVQERGTLPVPALEPKEGEMAFLSFMTSSRVNDCSTQPASMVQFIKLQDVTS